jgi:hypothetical protein
VPVFLANMTCAAWIKFSLFPGAAALMTIILALALLYLAFVHARWVHHVGSQSTRQRLDKGVRSICIALRRAQQQALHTDSASCEPIDLHGAPK